MLQSSRGFFALDSEADSAHACIELSNTFFECQPLTFLIAVRNVNTVRLLLLTLHRDFSGEAS